MQWHTQAGNITTSIKFELDFTLPELSARTFMKCKYHVNESTKGRCNMILVRYLLT